MALQLKIVLKPCEAPCLTSHSHLAAFAMGVSSVSSAQLSSWQVMKAADAAAEAEAAAARVQELEALLATQTASADAAGISTPDGRPTEPSQQTAALEARVAELEAALAAAGSSADAQTGGGDCRGAGSTEALNRAEAGAQASEAEALRARVAELDASAAELPAAAAEAQELKQRLSAAEVISGPGIQLCND